MMSNFLQYIILSCMLYKTVVTQVTVAALQNGTIATLTCNIISFTLPSSWINDSSSGSLSICLPAGACLPSTFGRYSFSATSSTIVARISAFDATNDNFGWKCQHNADTDVYRFTFTTTPTSISSSTTTTVSTTSTEMRTTSNYTTTTSTEIGTTQSTEITTLCPLPVVVIVAITFSGILSILLIIIICCCCCPCCCLYHCRMKQNTDTNGKELVETNGKGDAKNHTKPKVETQNPAYTMSNVPTHSFNPTVNQTCASDPDWEDKSVPNKNDIHESVQF